MRRWLKRVSLAAGVFFIVAAAVLWIGTQRQRRAVTSLQQRLASSRRASPSTSASHATLPTPVGRYLQWAVPEGTQLDIVTLSQEGSLRTDVQSDRWMAFRGTHLVSAAAPRFLWNARVAVAPLIHVRVIDSLFDGVGSGHVSLLSAIPVSTDSDTPEMNSGSLRRDQALLRHLHRDGSQEVSPHSRSTTPLSWNPSSGLTNLIRNAQ